MFEEHEALLKDINLNMQLPLLLTTASCLFPPHLLLYQGNIIKIFRVQVVMQESRKRTAEIIDQIWIFCLLELDPLQTHLCCLSLFPHVWPIPMINYHIRHLVTFRVIPDSFIHICNGFHLYLHSALMMLNFYQMTWILVIKSRRRHMEDCGRQAGVGQI